MPRISVTPEALTALAGSLAGVADELAWCAQRAGTDAWALGPGDSAGALARAVASPSTEPPLCSGRAKTILLLG